MENTKMTHKIKVTPKPSGKVTLNDYYGAMYAAQDIERPNRYQLLEIYDDIRYDRIVSIAMQKRILNVTGLQYSLTKESGRIDSSATNLFYQTWFRKLLTFIMEARFYGNSLIELQVSNGNIEPVLFPRTHVIPERKETKTYVYDWTGSSYDLSKYDNLIDVNNSYDPRNLGILANVAKLGLMKGEHEVTWMQTASVHGKPFTVATTDSQDPAELNAIEYFLKNMGSAPYAIKNSQTTIEFEEAGASSSQMMYDFNTNINNEITIAILGSSVTTQNYSEANSQERASNLITKDDIVFTESYVNDYVLPILKSYGMISQQTKYFSFDEPELLTVEQKLAVDTFLLEHFEIEDLDYFKSRYGVNKIKMKESNETNELEKPIEEDRQSDTEEVQQD